MNTQVNYLKAYCEYAIQRVRIGFINKSIRTKNKLELIKLICRCKNNHYLLCIHKFADSLTGEKTTVGGG